MQQLQSRPESKEALSQISLPTPIFDNAKTAIRIPSDDSDFGVEREIWQELDDRMLHVGFVGLKSRPPTFLRPQNRNVASTDGTSLAGPA
jgi:hypothetical protein